eukprot:scaffold16905_cov58-Phaeocystis_antarctica.AAC.4
MSMSFHVVQRVGEVGHDHPDLGKVVASDVVVSQGRVQVAVREREHDQEGVARGASHLRLLCGHRRRREHLRRGRASLCVGAGARTDSTTRGLNTHG